MDSKVEDATRTEEANLEVPEKTLKEVRTRLRRIVGQVQGIEKMLEDGRECKDVVMQLAAATKALQQAGIRLVASGMAYCVSEPEKASKEGYSLEEVEKMLTQLG